MKLSVAFISAFFLVLSFSGRSQETVMSSVNRHVTGRIGKTFPSVDGTFSSGHKKMIVALAPKRVAKKKPTKKTTKSKKTTKKAAVKNEKFKTTDEILTSKWYTGLLPDLPKHKQVKTRERKNKIPPKTVDNNMATTTFPLRTHEPYPIYFSDGSNNRRATKQVNTGVNSKKNQAKSKKNRKFRANPNNNAPSENTDISESLSVEGLEENGLAEHDVPSKETKSDENIGSSEKTELVENIGSSESTESVENIALSVRTDSVETIALNEKIESVENNGSSEKNKSVGKNGPFSESTSGKTSESKERDSLKASWEDISEVSSSIQKNPTYPANIRIEESGDDIKGTEKMRRSRSRILSCDKKKLKKEKKNTRKKGTIKNSRN